MEKQNQTIWKFEKNKTGNFSLNMPKDSTILCLQIDTKTETPCIWALVFPENELEERFFELYGTGHEIDNQSGIIRNYIGTYQKFGLVWHVFERISKN